MEPTIKQSLESLRQTLEKSSAASDKREDIEALRDDVREASESGQHGGLRERLDKALILFSDDHPDIASAIRAAINALTQSGV